MPGLKVGARVACQRLQLKIEKLNDVQLAGFVLLVELLVARLEGLPVKDAFAQ